MRSIPRLDSVQYLCDFAHPDSRTVPQVNATKTWIRFANLTVELVYVVWPLALTDYSYITKSTIPASQFSNLCHSHLL